MSAISYVLERLVGYLKASSVTLPSVLYAVASRKYTAAGHDSPVRKARDTKTSKFCTPTAF